MCRVSGMVGFSERVGYHCVPFPYDTFSPTWSMETWTGIPSAACSTPFPCFLAPSVYASPLASASGLLFSLPPLSASTTCSMSSGKAKVGIRATHNVIPEDLSAITVILFLVDSLLFIDSLIPQFFTTNFPSSYFQLLATFFGILVLPKSTHLYAPPISRCN